MGSDGQGGAHAAVSESGDVVYVLGAAGGAGMKLEWVDRGGDTTLVDPDWKIQPVAAGNWNGAALSPDGSRIAVTDGSVGGSQLWVRSAAGDAPPSRITFSGSFHVRPRWTGDGQAVTFISDLGGEGKPTQVWTKAADGSGAPRPLAADTIEIEEAVVSPDGQWLVYRRGGTRVGRDIYARRLDAAADSAGHPLVATDADEKSPQLSPDGRWLAYTSDESGQLEVFVRPFPNVADGKWQVSVGGGFSPLWAHNGRELFYIGSRDGAHMMAARVEARGGSLAVVSRQPLFAIGDQYVDQNYTAFDITPDDQRFLMFSFGSSGGGTMVWERNWLDEWRRRAAGASGT